MVKVGSFSPTGWLVARDRATLAEKKADPVETRSGSP
jgi:hypothetical protein